MIFDTIPVGQIDTNCYLIGDEKENVCAVVDPGGSPERVLARVSPQSITSSARITTLPAEWPGV